MFFAIILSIWLARNEIIFKGKAFHWVEIAELAIYRMSIWIKGKFEDIPYSVEDFRCNIDSVRNFKGVSGLRKARGVVAWVQPILGWMKFNVDGSSIGGVLRDDKGCFRCVFSEPIGVMDSNVAELMAIRKALNLFADSIWASSSKLIVASDSVVALAWVSGKEAIPWKLRFVFNDIGSLQSRISGVLYTRLLREGNMVADHFAKGGICRSVPFLAWFWVFKSGG
ncbi:hypothetical protein L1049_024620 [Liquidambar formosana]|uniref:RNase H type-1 domain-containing protein n=1 Tax=Liquidambar formosana TaxID=63359 RepID=A0AAP0WZT2_LIQFO